MTSSETKAINEGEKRFSSRPAGYLLGKFGLLVILAGLLLAAWYGQAVIVIVLGLFLSAAGLSKLWSRFSLAGVSCQRLLSERRVFPGEHVELRLRLVNCKLLPLPWIQIDDEIPVGFAPDVSLAPSSRTGFGFLSKATALLWYTGVSWKHCLYCHKRGYYTLGPIMVSSGDIFGFYPRSTTEPIIDHVIVYLRIFPVAQLGIPSLHPLGETTAERRIFEDPVRVIGVRDYSPRDSRRRIHWKASARHQNLQVKVFEPTTTLKAALFLAIDSFQHDGPQDEEGAILSRFQQEAPLDNLTSVVEAEELLELQKLCRQVYVEDSVRNYAVALARATRSHKDIRLGASPRASLGLHLASQALAAIRGRKYVIPDDIKHLAVPALSHRLIARTEARLRGRSVEDIVGEIVSTVPVPVEEQT